MKVKFIYTDNTESNWFNYKIINKMKIKHLRNGYYLYGNKGACWKNEIHIANLGGSTLCGQPMLATNWAAHWDKSEAGCKECIKIYKNSKDLRYEDLLCVIEHLRKEYKELQREDIVDKLQEIDPNGVWSDERCEDEDMMYLNDQEAIDNLIRFKHCNKFDNLDDDEKKRICIDLNFQATI